jgi:hypothetical protein
MNTATNANQPVHQIRIGAIKAALWKNSTQAGEFINVTFERIYKDGSEEWKSTTTFGRDDLLVLAKLADKVHDWIFSQRQVTA